jgi:hypothetical protein
MSGYEFNFFDYHSEPNKLVGYDKKNELLPSMVLDAVKKSGRSTIEQEKVIARSARYSFVYARDVLKKRFPLGEDTIAKDINYTLQYARDVVKGRWPKGEKILLTYSFFAYLYCKDIMKKTWVDAEKIIFNDNSDYGKNLQLLYTRDVLNKYGHI